MDGYKPTGEIVKNGKVYKKTFCITYANSFFGKVVTHTIHGGTCNECTAKKIKVKHKCK